MASGRNKKTPEPKSIGNETETQATDKRAATYFQPGNKLGGRPKGSRNKFAEEFIKDFLADWEVAGASAIQACRLEDPAAYVRIAASLVPKEFNFKPGESNLDAILDQLSDEQLAQFHALLSSFCIAAEGGQQKTKALPRSKSNGVH